MSVRWSPGAVLRIDLPEGRHAHAVMLAEFPYLAFYDSAVDLPDGEPLFIVAVQRNTYSKGGWGKPVARLRPDDLPPLPRVFRQDDYAVDSCVICEPDGEERPATPQECVGLERQAVWADMHVESRLADHYAGRPNRIVEDQKVRLS